MGSKYFKSILVYEDDVHERVLNTLILFRLIFAAKKDSFVYWLFILFFYFLFQFRGYFMLKLILDL